jgi:hypothetical protein
MGKSISHKIQKEANRKNADKEKTKDSLLKAKKSSHSIKKTGKKEVDQKIKEMDELKQLLNLEPPKIDLDMFNTMKLGEDGKQIKKHKMTTK